MNDDWILKDRGRVDADFDVPEARPGAPHHDEWIIDEAVEETFPASDAPTPPRPGSLAAQRYARAASRDARSATRRRIVIYAAAALAVLLLWRTRARPPVQSQRFSD